MDNNITLGTIYFKQSKISRVLPLAFFRYPLENYFTNIQYRESRTIKKHYILCSVFQKITNCRHVQIEI